MDPDRTSERLARIARDSIAGKLEFSDSMWEIHTVLASLDKTSAQVSKFINREYVTAINGMDRLIEKLQKASRTLNPQDESREVIESSLEELREARGVLMNEYKGLGRVSI